MLQRWGCNVSLYNRVATMTLSNSVSTGIGAVGSQVTEVLGGGVLAGAVVSAATRAATRAAQRAINQRLAQMPAPPLVLVLTRLVRLPTGTGMEPLLVFLAAGC